MAVERKSTTAASPARTEGSNSVKKTLGFFNLNMATKAGAPIRVDAIRFVEGNKSHEQLAAYLSVTRPGDEKYNTPETLADEKARRLAEVVSKLEFSYNPTRTDEESMLDLT
jgi:hypothetical protein